MKKVIRKIVMIATATVMVFSSSVIGYAATGTNEVVSNSGYVEIDPFNVLILQERNAASNIAVNSVNATFGNAVRVWFRNDSSVWTYVALTAPNGAVLGRFSVAPGSSNVGYLNLWGAHNQRLNLSITPVNGSAPIGRVAVRQLAV